MILRMGEKRFGPPDAATRAAVGGLTDLARLEELGVSLLDANSWQELLPAPAPKPRRRKGG
jgi:hypothetical protein